jgi:hypothetical protein
MVASENAFLQLKMHNHSSELFQRLNLIHHFPILSQTAKKVPVRIFNHEG